MIKWQKDLEIGIKEIDNEHQMLIDVLNKVYEACSRGEGLAQINEVALFLEWYVDKHFGDEERLQKRIGYPVMRQHIKKHRIYQKRVKELLEDLKNEEVTTEHIAKVTIYLQTMIKEHIKQDDRALAYYIKNNKTAQEQVSTPEVQVDQLTGLIAKDEFRTLMKQRLKQDSRDRRFYIVMTIDHFGNVNRTYGYDIGEEVLIYVAGILHMYQDEGILIGRNHQDEFVMLIEDHELAEVELILEEVCRKVYYGFKRAGSVIPLSLSMGVLEITEEIDQKHIKQNGVIALKRAQEAGGNQRVYFEKNMYKEIIRNSKIVNQLQIYNANAYLFVVYQPIFDVQTGKIKGAEALLRMKDEDGDIISPGEFIPIAEKNHLIVDVGYFCVRQVCQDFKHLMALDAEIDYISINLSVEQIKEKNLVEQIYKIAKEEGIDLSKLYFEITESMLVQDFIDISEMIREFKRLGCKILLDDFGSGYSALSYLSRIDTDILKIDKTLIEGIEDIKVLTVLKHTLELAKALGMETVVEGIETEEEFELLKKLHADKAQGYYISRPLALDAFIDKIKN